MVTPYCLWCMQTVSNTVAPPTVDQISSMQYDQKEILCCRPPLLLGDPLSTPNFGLCSDDVQTLVDRADDELCEKVIGSPHHVLHSTLGYTAQRDSCSLCTEGVGSIAENL